ncbi:hypothetical protein CEXT_114151 [Caerostris extrusa]|uniref:Uncharacterized protein n=1 Tax=Caerostris extrusa TaxID=172846 RepID=A0AAV4RDV6_CAEEX|nr:hypothetical protein CEXT_114151 [Caerostris extrusa]
MAAEEKSIDPLGSQYRFHKDQAESAGIVEAKIESYLNSIRYQKTTKYGREHLKNCIFLNYKAVCGHLKKRVSCDEELRGSTLTGGEGLADATEHEPVSSAVSEWGQGRQNDTAQVAKRFVRCK